MSEDVRRPNVADLSKVGELRIQVGQLKIRFLEIYEKYPQFVIDAGGKWGLKSVQYECHMKLCFKRHVEDGRISLDAA